jgi:hypothetical protein
MRKTFSGAAQRFRKIFSVLPAGVFTADFVNDCNFSNFARFYKDEVYVHDGTFLAPKSDAGTL